ncbi:peptidylprolyl isomerase [[Emmonsia] crescens]|uniref:peptidylprolyl isomerase n=1 Tax=[Emmonsia] crescens TaxID=73230 RepID=A0A0G2JAG8_9EURO|nr:peptidylprolyl isomerase [Emmonsia crescens UAMH 3008]
MGVTTKVLRNGNGVNKPMKGDEVAIDYTGCLYDETATDKYCMGDEFDSSKDRGEFRTTIGVGRVIRGWDEAVMNMTLGEKSILTISGDFAYGDREVELKGINNMRAA